MGIEPTELFVTVLSALKAAERHQPLAHIHTGGPSRSRTGLGRFAVCYLCRLVTGPFHYHWSGQGESNPP